MKRIYLGLLVLVVVFVWGCCALASTTPEGFEYKLTSYAYNGYHTEFVGTITNNSGKYYKIAEFQLDVYSDDLELLDVVTIYINNFQVGQTKGFEVLSAKKFPKSIKYSISFNSGY